MMGLAGHLIFCGAGICSGGGIDNYLEQIIDWYRRLKESMTGLRPQQGNVRQIIQVSSEDKIRII